MIKKLNEGIKKLNLDFSDLQIIQFEKYIHEVLEFNKFYNLMKAEDEDELAVNHILDSLVAIPYLEVLFQELCEKTKNNTLEIADIGSGGGCPGIPLAISFPNHHFTLVERMEKRCDFLTSVINKLEMKNVRVECCSADMITKESFDLEVFRAFHPFDLKITNLLLRMVKKNGYLVAYKAREEKIKAEMETIKLLVKDYNRIKVTVPFLEDHERNLVVIKNV